MGGMSTRNEIKARLGVLADQQAKATASRFGHALRSEISNRLGLFGKSSFAGDRGCGTGAGGFQPGNTCGKEDGKGAGGGEAKKKKPKKPKKPVKPRKEPKEPKETDKTRREQERDDAMLDSISDNTRVVDEAVETAVDYMGSYGELRETLRGRVDSQAKRMLAKAKQLNQEVRDLQKASSAIDTDSSGGLRRGVQTSQQLAERAKDVIRRINEFRNEVRRSGQKGAKHTPQRHLERVTDNFWDMYENAPFDTFDLEMDLSQAGGSRTKQGKALKQEVDALARQMDSVADGVPDAGDVADMEDPAEIKRATEQAIAATKQYAALRQQARDLSRRIQEHANRARPAKKAKKATSSRRKLRAGLLDRLGAAVGALTQKTVSPSTPAYQTTLEAAKKQAVEAVKSYEYMRDLNAQQFKALDDYVKATAKAIATLRSVPDIQRLTSGIVRATTSRNHARQYLKTPFARPGATANFCDVSTKGLDYRARAAKGRQSSDLEREDVKAGLKLMSESDPAVSAKIRKLMAEGKPQEQAVAIALDMKRRGEI